MLCAESALLPALLGAESALLPALLGAESALLPALLGAFGPRGRGADSALVGADSALPLAAAHFRSCYAVLRAPPPSAKTVTRPSSPVARTFLSLRAPKASLTARGLRPRYFPALAALSATVRPNGEASASGRALASVSRRMSLAPILLSSGRI